MTKVKTFGVCPPKIPVHNPRKNEPKKNTPEYKLAREIRGTRRWRLVRKKALLLTGGLCVYCYAEPADEVHHIKKVSEFPELAFDLDNLAPLSEKHHTWMTVRAERGEDIETQIRDKMEKHLGVRSLKDLKGPPK